MKNLFSKKADQHELKNTRKSQENGTYILPDGTRYTSKYTNECPNKGDDYSGNIKQESLILEDGAEYFGEVFNGEAHGYGICNLTDGSKYVGEFKKGKFSGYGLVITVDGTKFIGGFKDNELYQYGLFVEPDGAKYMGEIKGGIQNGYGIHITGDGSGGIGTFIDGNMNGEGMIICPDGSKYYGSIKNNNFHGRGMVSMADGSAWAAEFKNNKIHRLVGSFDDNKKANSSRNTSQQDVGKLLLKMTGYTALFTGSLFHQLVKLNNKPRKY